MQAQRLRVKIGTAQEEEGETEELDSSYLEELDGQTFPISETQLSPEQSQHLEMGMSDKQKDVARLRDVYVIFPQLRESVHNLPLRGTFPTEIAWATMSSLGPEKESVPALVAIRGEITKFTVHANGREEVDIELIVFPPLEDAIYSARRGHVADRLLGACIRAANVFPARKVKVGASFEGYLANRLIAPQPSHDPTGRENPPRSEKIVWEVRLRNGPTSKQGSLANWWRRIKELTTVEGWVSSETSDGLYTDAETSLITPLHGVLTLLWHQLFYNDDVARESITAPYQPLEGTTAKLVSGKITFRPWMGPDLFQDP